MFDFFLSLVDSQSLVIGNPETDTDNDFTNCSGSSYHSSNGQSSKAKQLNKKKGNSSHLNFTDALQALRDEGIRTQTQTSLQSQADETQLSQQQQQPQAEDNIMNVDDYPEDEEWAIDRQVRLQEEQEEEERRQRIGSSGRLTAPPREIRRRKRTQPANQNTAIDHLREKQMKLVDEQLKLQSILLHNASIAQEDALEQLKRQKILTQNASIAQEEGKERLKLATIERMLAEKTFGTQENN